MELQFGFQRPDAYRRGFVSIGNFDGVHRGHQAMARQLASHAHREGCPAVILTFDPPPAAILTPDRIPPRLTTVRQKAELLGDCGVDCVIVYPTDRDLLRLTSREFFSLIVRDELEARGLVEGPNFRFGHRRAGDVEVLREYCQETGISLDVIAPAVSATGEVVSSTDVRKAVSEGRVRDAAALLGRPHVLEGRVIEGSRRGRTIGFPTANLDGIEVLLPPNGVYAGRANVENASRQAAIHIGPNPTFGEDSQKVEVHLLDFSGDLYASQLRLELIDRIRGVERFENVEALKRQLTADLQKVREITGR